MNLDLRILNKLFCHSCVGVVRNLISLFFIICFSCKNEKKQSNNFTNENNNKQDSTKIDINVDKHYYVEGIDSSEVSKSKYEIIFYDVDREIDTLVDFSFLEDEINYEFKYEKLKKYLFEDSLIFVRFNDTIKINSEPFNSKNHTISYDQNGYVDLIDDSEAFGIDGYIPKESIKSIYCKINNETFLINNSNIKNLFEPNLGNSQVYFKENEFIIQMTNSDGAGGYLLTFFVRDEKDIKRIISMP